MQSTLNREKLGEMRMAHIFDTLKYTKRAIAAGISEVSRRVSRRRTSHSN